MLVDTSVWIGFLNGHDNASVLRLKEALAVGEAIAITGVIFQEILQGADTTADYERLRLYFEGQAFLHPRDPVASFADAARLYVLCRRAGITIRGSLDCLIAQIAIEHEVPLLHKDRDFVRMAEILPGLTLA